MTSYPIPEKVRIVYFTGTGGTALAAKKLDDHLSARGVTVLRNELNVLEAPDAHIEVDFLILMFPVYAFNAPNPVYQYIKNHRTVGHIPAAVISISGGGEVTINKASRLHTIQRLEKAGYRVVYERMLVMPSNFIEETPHNLALHLIEILPKKIAKITDDLLSGTIRRIELGRRSRAASALGECEKWVSGLFGKFIRADNNCSACGLCSAFCPTDNISMKNNKPVFGFKCVTCLRCIYGCPENALSPCIMKSLILTNGYSLASMTAESDSRDATAIDENPGKTWDGLRLYFNETD